MLAPSAHSETQVDGRQPWARKHRERSQFYADARQKALFTGVGRVAGRRWESLVDLDIAIIKLLCAWLGVERQMVCLGAGGSGERSSLLNICRHFDCPLLSGGNAAQSYLDVDLFVRHGMESDGRIMSQFTRSSMGSSFRSCRVGFI